MATYVNDLRLKEIATGDEAGTWGTSTNTNLQLIGEALGYGTQDCFATDADATTTVADGATDPARAMYFKVTSSATLTATRTLTIAPNTVSRVMLIENATTGSQSIAISQGSGGNVTIASGQVKMVYLDGAGAGGAVVDAMASLELGTITVANLTATTADINGGTADGVVIGGSTPAAITGTTVTANTSLTVNATTTITDILDEDNMASDSATALATQQSIKAYVDSQVGTVDTLAEILANGNTTGGTDIAVGTGDDITFADSSKAIFGAGADLQIYHDGSNSYIQDEGTGGLIISSDGPAVYIQKGTTETSAEFNTDGAVKLRYDNVTKFETTATGIDVTGTVTADGLTISNPGGSSARFVYTNNDQTNLRIKLENSGSGGNTWELVGGNAGANNADFTIYDATNTAKRAVFSNNGDISFYEDTGTTAKLAWSASNERLTLSGSDYQFGIVQGANEPWYLRGVSDGSLRVHLNGTGDIATFNSSGNVELSGRLYVPEYIEHSGDSNTYFGFPGGDEFALIAGAANRLKVVGSETVLNEDGGDRDFRVESDSNANMLFVDASTDRVHIGGSNVGDGELNVNDMIRISGAAPELRIDIGSAGYYLQLTEEYNFPKSIGHIRSVANTSYDGQLQFSANQGGGAYRELARMDYVDGTVFNETSVDIDFRVESDSNTHALFVDAGEDSVSIRTSSRFNGGALSVSGTIAFNNQTAGTYIDNVGWIDFTDSGNLMRLHSGGSAGQSSAIEISTNISGSQSDAITVETGGTVVINQDSADRDFRVESDNNANMLFVDAGNDQVGIGTSSPAAALDVLGTIKANTSTQGDSGAQLNLWSNASGNTFIAGYTLSINTGANNARTQSLYIDNSGNVTISGSLSKGSGSFKIDHPLPEKNDTHHLVHSFVEAPQADNIYRGKVALVAGSATVNIDTVAGMTEGTFALLNREVQCFTSNESGWTAVRGKVDGNILTIEAQDPACTDTISWMVVGERQDQHMYDTDWTDENGKVIVEPLKETEGA